MGFSLTEPMARTATETRSAARRSRFLPPSRRAEKKPHRGPIRRAILSSKYTDDETGLQYSIFRYYHPELGRWISRDPLGEHAFSARYLRHVHPASRRRISAKATQEPYQLVGNDPIARYDPLGLLNSQEKIWCAKHPVCCCAVRNSHKDTRAAMMARYGLTEPQLNNTDQSAVNAVLHCAWMCWVSSHLACGMTDAIELGEAHESDTPPLFAHDKAMDLCNNKVGASLAFAVYDLSTCIQQCETRAKDHKLYWHSTPPIPPGFGLDPAGLPTDYPGFTVDADGKPGPGVGSGSATPPVFP